MKRPSADLLQALAATAEILQADLTDGAARVLLRDLSAYDEPSILAALQRLRLEGGRFSVDAIVRRLPGMWPGADQAWAEFPRDEADSGCVTDEAMQAWGIARNLTDSVAARMAFKDAYTQLVAEARAQGKRPRWQMSLGHDPDLRELATIKALRDNRLSQATVAAYLPHIDAHDLPRLAQGEPLRQLEGSVGDEQMARNKARLKQLMSALRGDE